jgi:hypothetical protein
MAAVVVVDEHGTCGLHRSGRDVPRVVHQVCAEAQEAGVGHPAGRHDDHVGLEVEHVPGLHQMVERELHPQPLALGDAPVDDPDEVVAARCHRREPQLPARAVGGLEHRHVVPPLGEKAGGLQPGDPGADDHHRLPHPGGWHPMRQAELPPSRRVVDAIRGLGDVRRVDADARTHARPDPVLVAAAQLLDQVRVGEHRARHADQVEQALGDGMPGRRNVSDLAGVHDRHVNLLLDHVRERQVRSGLLPHRRDDPRQPRLGGDVAPDDTDEVDAASVTRRAIASPSSTPSPSGRCSSSAIRMPTTKSGPTASRTAWM